jgi:transposase
MTPAYSNEEAAPAPVALIEDESSDFQTPQYIDGVYHTVEGEESEASEDEQAEADAGTADSSETSFFESQALASGAAADGDWTTPEYAAESAAAEAAQTETVEAELTALLQTAETLLATDDSKSWQTPEYSDAQAATGAKQYARVITSETETSLIESEAETQTATQTEAEAEAEVKIFTPRYIRSRSGRFAGRFPAAPRARINRFRSAGADMFHTQKRFRASDAEFPRPRWNRHDPHTPRHGVMRAISGMAFRNAERNAYDKLEQYCSTRLPESFGKFCRPVLRRFRRISEGLSYGDRVPQVCMAANLCKQSSYVVDSPHDRLEERTF